jgi:hypothetical protein
MVIKHYGHLSPDFIGKEIREKTEGMDLGPIPAVSNLKILGTKTIRTTVPVASK